MDPNSKIIVAMMRLPFQKETNTKIKEKSARINSDRGYGVVVSAVRSMRKKGINCTWVGSWYDKGAENKKLEESLGPNYVPIFLPAQLEENYYAGFCKQVLWPLLHYQMIQSSFNVKWWNAYVLANEIFADTIAKI
jgi:trehalose-6-phosphate synthase